MHVGKVGRKALLPPSVEISLVDCLICVSESYLGVTPQHAKKIAGYFLFKDHRTIKLRTPLTQTDVAFIIQAALNELQRRRRNEDTHIDAHSFCVTSILL